MGKTTQYAILRFAKYKGPEISGIESHNERTKEKYNSNPDIDTSRSYLNFHLVTPERKYRAEARLQSDYQQVKAILDRIPPKIIQAYTQKNNRKREADRYNTME